MTMKEASEVRDLEQIHKKGGRTPILRCEVSGSYFKEGFEQGRLCCADSANAFRITGKKASGQTQKSRRG